MTLRAEDFTWNGTFGEEKQKRASACVEKMNAGILAKDYPLYQQGVTELMAEVGADIPHLQSVMNRKTFLFDLLSHFLNEVMDTVFTVQETPFSTRIGIGELFLNPTLEVRLKGTGDVLAVFDDPTGYRLVKPSLEQVEALQDGFIAGIERWKVLEDKMKKAEQLMADPMLILNPAFNGFLSEDVAGKGIWNEIKAHALRINHLAFYSTEAGEQELLNEMGRIRTELGTLQASLDDYPEALELLKRKDSIKARRQGILKALLDECRVPDKVKLYQERE